MADDIKTMTLTHLHCTGAVTIEKRTVMTAGNDTAWPKNIEVQVPYCTVCKTVVNLTDVVADVEVTVDGGEVARGVLESIDRSMLAREQARSGR